MRTSAAPMRILLIGNHGQLGFELERALSTLGEIIATDFPQINLANPVQVRDLVQQTKPNLIVNPAAYTSVDQAEIEADLSMSINGIAPGILAEEAKAVHAALIHYSTDYVFDGSASHPYVEDNSTNPLNTYGRTKLVGEQNVQSVDGSYIILRTCWVYGFRRPSFASKALQWSRSQKTMRVVTDQIASPTWCRVLAEITAQAISQGSEDIYSWLEMHHGLYHVAGDGIVSRFDFSKAVLELDPHKEEQIVQEFLPALTADFPTPALRPLYSPLNCDRFAAIFGLRLPPWKSALQLALAD